MKRRSSYGVYELIVGILLILLGIFTFTRPQSALTGLVVLYGLLATITGSGDIVFYVKMEKHTGFGPTISLISGILSVMTGLVLMVHPGAGRWAMMVFFPIWFIAHCISRLSHGHMVRFVAGSAAYWFSLIINSLGLALGFLMLIKPYYSLLSITFMIGVYLILLGLDSLGEAFSRMGENW